MEFFEITQNPNHTLLTLRNGFEMVIVNNTIRITSNIINITSELELSEYSFTNSDIISCSINNNIIESPNYSKLLTKIYDLINNGVKIITTPSTFNIKTGEHTTEGFHYLPNIGISYQRKDANGTIREIYKQSRHHNIQISIKIKLSNNIIIQI
jgi:hypothetical protein